MLITFYLEQKNSHDGEKNWVNTGRSPQNFPALLDKIVIHLTKLSALRQNCDPPSPPPPPKKNQNFWYSGKLNFKMASFCKVDPRCGNNLMQCVYNGV